MSQARRHCHILLFLALLLHKGALLLTNCGALKKSLNLSFLTSSSGKKNIRITADLLGPFSCKCLRVIPAWVGPVWVLNTPTMSLTPSLCVKWGLRSINHLTEGRHKNHWAPYAQKPWWCAQNPRGTQWCDLGFLLSTPHAFTSPFTQLDHQSEAGNPLSLFRASSAWAFC